MYQRAKIGGYCHLNLGEEATCVGLCAGMQPNDYLFTNYREHGYALARGIDPGRDHGRAVRPRRRRLARPRRVDAPVRLGQAADGRLRHRRRAASARHRRGPGHRPQRRATTRWCARWATRRPISAPSTSRSTWPRCGNCPWCTRSSTTASAWAPRSRLARRSPRCTRRRARTASPASRSTATTSWPCATRSAKRSSAPAPTASRRLIEHQELPPQGPFRGRSGPLSLGRLPAADSRRRTRWPRLGGAAQASGVHRRRGPGSSSKKRSTARSTPPSSSPTRAPSRTRASSSSSATRPRSPTSRRRCPARTHGQ